MIRLYILVVKAIVLFHIRNGLSSEFVAKILQTPVVDGIALESGMITKFVG